MKVNLKEVGLGADLLEAEEGGVDLGVEKEEEVDGPEVTLGVEGLVADLEGGGCFLIIIF